MSPRLRVGSLALSSVLAFSAILQGVPPRVELAGGWPKRAVTTMTTEVPAAPVRPLAPGEVLVLGPTAAPLSAPMHAPEPRLPGNPRAAASPEVDTVVVAAPPAPAPGASPSGVPAGWEIYRTGNVVRIALP